MRTGSMTTLPSTSTSESLARLVTIRAMTEPEIAFLDGANLIELRPLWLELLDHHLTISPPQLPTGVSEAQSWERRRSEYEEWLVHPKAFCLVARVDDVPVAYALVSVHGPEILFDTWDGAEEIAELQTLVVSETVRSDGLGGRMLSRVESEVRDRQISEMIIASVSTNDGAVAFYLRHGYAPYLTYFYRHLDRPASPPEDPRID